MRILDHAAIRLGVVLLLAFKVCDDLFATVLTLTYRAGALGAAQSLGRLTPGDDYQRLIPLMDAVPPGIHGLWVLAAGFYLLALLMVALRRGPAYIFALAAPATELLANELGRPIIAATGVVVNPQPSLLATMVLPYLLPLALALLLWIDTRNAPSLRQQH